ncbi:MAG: phenylalanine--tRNA ligase subunit alpha [Candidatus Micrarchaeota archaeon]|nr:phenylalanine--tRNA ligase subunit alpha [Candidatus Micrarchaeota archaeon]
MNSYEKAVLESIITKGANASQIAQMKGLDVSGIFSAIESLKEKGAVEAQAVETTLYELSAEGEHCVGAGLPEENVTRKAAEKNGCPLDALSDAERKIGLSWAIKKGLVGISEGRVKATAKGLEMIEKGYTLREKLKAKEHNDELVKRGLLVQKKVKDVVVRITPAGKKMLAEEPKEAGTGAIDKLTHKDIVSGGWKGKLFKAYNVSAAGEMPQYGRENILRRFRKRISEIFTEMGFEEMEGGLVESAFWNFDALFQPQDHPARELADTFYLKGPARIKLSKDAPISKVREVHLEKWGGHWSLDEAEKAILRTHTTAVSSRKLSELNVPQGKFFAIGRIFRNEAIDYKHLAEFHQVEGIIAWDKANFRNLLWVLREFYRKLGFEKILFKPSYFPYTEPSLEIHAYFKEKKMWVELGGAGIFREEVCYPLFGRYPVLAWGLSLERPLMIMLGIEDIRAFYRNDLRELEKYKEGTLTWLFE